VKDAKASVGEIIIWCPGNTTIMETIQQEEGPSKFPRLSVGTSRRLILRNR
jgi:hypothetical protein